MTKREDVYKRITAASHAERAVRFMHDLQPAADDSIMAAA